MATNSLTRPQLINGIPTEWDRVGSAAKPAQGIHSSELGRQIYNTAMALPGVGGVTKLAGTGGLISRAFNTTAGAANRLAAGSVGTVGATVIADELPASPAAKSNALVAAVAPTPPNQPQGQSAPAASVAATPDQSAANPLTNNITKTVGTSGATSYSGENITDGFTMNGKAAPYLMGGGVVSARNMSAADRLAGGDALVQRAGAIEPGGLARMQAPTVEHSGNSWQARENLRRQKMDATSLIHRSHWAPKGSGLAAQANYGRALAADQHAQGKQVDADMAAMQTNAGVQQEQMRQDGADRRDSRRSLVDLARWQGEQETQGYANRAAAQQEQLRNKLLDPASTPEQRAVAQRSLAALSGKSAADRMQTVTLPDTTNDMGQVVRGGQALVRLLEDGSVQQVPITGAQQGASRAAPQEAIEQLQKNPASAAQFDAIFGAGASKQYLR